MADRNTPRLTLLTPPLEDGAAFAPTLEAALAAADVACVVVRFAMPDEGGAKRVVKALLPVARARDVALLVAGSPALAARTDADGAHVTGVGDGLDAALESLKPDRIVGVGGLKLRDDAMVAGEGEVDYLMFGEPRADGSIPDAAGTLEDVEWWAEIFNVPCVGYAHALDDIAPLASAGAEFVALCDAIWDDPRGPAAAMRAAVACLGVEAGASR